MLSLAQPPHYYQFFLAQGVGAGIGMGLIFVPSLSVCAHYFRKRRSLAMGIIIAGPCFISCCHPLRVIVLPRVQFRRLYISNHAQQSFLWERRVRMGHSVRLSKSLRAHVLTVDRRAVGFMDLVLLVIANLIMRTRLPPNKNKGKNSLIVKEILTDGSYIVYMAGTFLVSRSNP